MLFKYMYDGQEIGAFTGVSMTEARVYAKENSIDWETIDEYPDDKTTPNKKYQQVLGETVEVKARKPRADKGQPRVTKKDTSVTKKVSQKVGNKRDKKRQYFIYSNSGEEPLSKGLSHDEAIKRLDSIDGLPRIIMGHEISFSRKIQFHN